MNKQFVTVQVKQVNTEDRTLTAYASTEHWDRDGDRIMLSAWDGGMSDFAANPVLGWAHRYDIPPIGKITDIGTDGHGLKFTTQFANTPFATEIWELYRDGFLNAFSVGFIPGEWAENDKDADGNGRIYTSVSLLEISAVMVPANQHSLVARGGPVVAFKSLDDFTQPALAEKPPEPESAEIKDDSAVDLPDSATMTVTSGYVSVDNNGTAANPWITVTSTNGDLIYHVSNKDHESDLQPDPVLTEPPAAVTEPPNAVTEADDANDYAEPDPADDALLEALNHFVDEIRDLLT